MGNRGQKDGGTGKRVFAGFGDVHATIPPEDDAPPSTRHPMCDFCNNKMILLGPGMRMQEMTESLTIDHDISGWEVTFVCHGRTDPTRVIRITMRLGEISGPKSKRNADGTAADPPIPPNREAEIIQILGAEMWTRKGINFRVLCGSVDEPRAPFRGARAISPHIGIGTFLVFKDAGGSAHVVQLPVAHIAVRRP